MESHGSGPVTLNFNNGQTVLVEREFWTKNGLDKFDIVRAKKHGKLILFYGEQMSDEDRMALKTNEAKEVQTSFDVVLTSFGGSKLKVVKHVKDITGLGLRESMALVTDLGTIKSGISEVEANMIKERVEAEGATVEVK